MSRWWIFACCIGGQLLAYFATDNSNGLLMAQGIFASGVALALHWLSMKFE